MLYDLNFRCTDDLGTWISNSSKCCDSDEEATAWATNEINYLRERWPGTNYSEIVLVECDLSPMCVRGDRVVTEIQ